MELMSLNLIPVLRRRRRGSTSPPLVGIELNPGPKGGRRKSHKAKRPQHYLTEQEKKGIKKDLEDCTMSYSAIAKKYHVKEETVSKIGRREASEKPKKRGPKPRP